MELGEHRLVPEADAAGTEGTDTDDTGTNPAIVRTQEGAVTVAGIDPRGWSPVGVASTC
jgi:hypothetical protein